MFFLIFCLSFWSLYLGIQGDGIIRLISGILLLISLVSCIFYTIYYSKLRLLLFSSFILGTTCAIGYVYYLNSNVVSFKASSFLRTSKISTYVVEGVQGKVLSKSINSVVIQFNSQALGLNNTLESSFLRIRAYKSKNSLLQKDIHLWDIVIFSCKPNMYKQDSLFSSLEILQGISLYCRNATLTIAKKSSFISRMRTRSSRYLYKALEKLPKSTLAYAILLSDTKTLATKELEMFQKMGVSHLFSVSGLHLGLIFMFFFLPFSWLGYKKSGMLIALLVAVFFVILLDFRISLLRAFLFVFLFCILSFFERKTSPLIVLFFSAFCIELLFPLSSFQASFIFSFGITAGILFLYPIFKKNILVESKWIGSQVSITLSAWCISVFFSTLFFQNFHAISFLYNLILVPITSIYLFLLLCGIFIPIFLIPVNWIDTIYHGFAYMHHYLWNRFFPTTTLSHLYIYCLCLFLLLGVFLFFWFRGHTLHLRKYTLKIYFIFLMCFFIPFIWNKPSDKTTFWAFPYGVGEYYNRILYLHGTKASFITQDNNKPFLRNRLFEQLPIKKIQMSSSLEPYLASFWSFPLDLGDHSKWFSSYINITEDKSSQEKWGVLKVKSQVCFIFFSLMKPEKWTKNFLESCMKIYFVVSKKQQTQINSNEFYPFFQEFGFLNRRELDLVGYFQMIEETTDLLE